MRIVAHRGNQLHAPENTITSLISAYTSGANVLEFDVQLTKDNNLVISHDGAVNRLTGFPPPDLLIKDLELKELRWGNFDFSENFNPWNKPTFRYYLGNKRFQIETLSDLLDRLPNDIIYLIELKHDSSNTDNDRKVFVNLFASEIKNRGLFNDTVVYSKDKLSLRLLKQLIPEIKTAVFDWELSKTEQLNLLRDENADGLVTSVENVMVNESELTDFGKTLKQFFKEKKLSLGAILYPYRKPGVITEKEFHFVSQQDFIWSVSTDSMIGKYSDNGTIEEYSQLFYPQFDWLPTTHFSGEEIDRDWFAFGYAKANKYCFVFQANGVHIDNKAYDGFLPLPNDPDNVQERLNKLELRMLYVEKSWPFYSGGGLGVIKPINGDFIATVDYLIKNPMTQAQTLEMAVTNVDPGAHQSKQPTSFRQADAFYDPHGCPPYVGVEHDENDGYRINWNLGSDYDNNQYGSPVGNGKIPQEGTLRLERRGAYFSAYYRNKFDAPYWICVGTVKNESLNETVFLRCVAKRWLQEKEDDPSGYHDVMPNKFTFTNLRITKPIK